MTTESWYYVPVGSPAENMWRKARPSHWLLDNVTVTGTMYHGGYVYHQGQRGVVPMLMELHRIVKAIEADVKIYSLNKSKASDFLMDWFTRLRFHLNNTPPVQANFEKTCAPVVLNQVRIMAKRLKGTRDTLPPHIDALDSFYNSLLVN